MSSGTLQWLQWSSADLENGLGGVEVHARSLARELRSLGIDAMLSSDPKELENPKWDVVHTHGSAFSPARKPAISVHTLHGTTIGRMNACGEWTWPGGYRAWTQEIAGTLRADVTLSVHPGLSLFGMAKRLPKISRVCWNGWDAGKDSVASSLPPELARAIASGKPFWLFVGRGEDRMKGADYVLAALETRKDVKLVAAPGAGFERRESTILTGRLNSAQVRALMEKAHGLLIPSRYEGHSLVVLEALAEGLPVVATPVGGVPLLSKELDGLVALPRLAKKTEVVDSILHGMETVDRMDHGDTARERRKSNNRRILPTWNEVARTAVSAVEDAMRKRSQ